MDQNDSLTVGSGSKLQPHTKVTFIIFFLLFWKKWANKQLFKSNGFKSYSTSEHETLAWHGTRHKARQNYTGPPKDISSKFWPNGAHRVSCAWPPKLYFSHRYKLTWKVPCVHQPCKFPKFLSDHQLQKYPEWNGRELYRRLPSLLLVKDKILGSLRAVFFFLFCFGHVDHQPRWEWQAPRQPSPNLGRHQSKQRLSCHPEGRKVVLYAHNWRINEVKSKGDAAYILWNKAVLSTYANSQVCLHKPSFATEIWLVYQWGVNCSHDSWRNYGSPERKPSCCKRIQVDSMTVVKTWKLQNEDCLDSPASSAVAGVNMANPMYTICKLEITLKQL